MSFDPFSYPPVASPTPPPAAAVAPEEAAFRAARERVVFPALLVVALGLINLLAALFQLGGFLYVAVRPADKLHAEQIEQADRIAEHTRWPAVAEAADEMRQKAPEQLRRQGLISNGLVAAWLLVVAVVGISGGLRMMRLRSYSLAMLGSFTTALPCVSVSGTCCGVGQIVGLWAVWVLLSVDVRMTFR